MNDPSLLQSLRTAAQGEVRAQEPLASRTSVRVGGPARFFVRPGNPEALVSVLQLLARAKVAWHVLGGGANTIVGDGGIDGCVLRLSATFVADQVEESGDHVILTLGAGATPARFLALAREQGCVGTAWAAGIPGTVGGLCAMNAGTPAGCMADHLLAVEVASPDGLRWIEAPALALSYRHCELPKGAVVTRARCRVRRGSTAELRAEEEAQRKDLERRRTTQPLTQPNSGSVFVNPAGDHAGRLIEAAGLKGARRGGAQISERHANFIVNLGEAKASEVVELITLAQSEVKARFNFALTPEVRLVGTFQPPLPSNLSAWQPALLPVSA